MHWAAALFARDMEKKRKANRMVHKELFNLENSLRFRVLTEQVLSKLLRTVKSGNKKSLQYNKCWMLSNTTL